MTTALIGPEPFQQAHGGVSRYTLELLRHLPAWGVAPQAFAGLYSTVGVRDEDPIVGARTRPFRGRSRLNGQLFDAYSYARSRRHRLVVHHTFHPSRPAGPRAAHSPLVVTVCDVIPARYPDMFSDAPTMLEWQQSWAVKADLLIAISESTRRDAVEFLGAAPERTVTVPLGVSTAPVGDEPRTASQLLYVGSRAGYKNWRALVEAMASPALREATLVCAGGGPFTPAEVELLGAHGLRPRVQVRDVSDTELTRLYRRSAALVYPSLYEGFGLPPLEAMANGCPVIATDAGSVGEVVGDAACVIDPADPASLADGIERVLGDDAYRQALSARGERRAALFTWSRTAELTSNCYRTLAG